MKANQTLAKMGDSDAGVVTLDPHALVTSRLLVTANSGGGKSYLLRKLIEQVGSAAQTFVLDLEGEFASLREKLDLVIVGPGGEIPADVRSAGLLARRLMEKGISAVIDLSELKFHQRRTFVRVFLESLMELPKTLWHPLFVVIDEAHQFAPEKGHGEAESLQAVRDLCTLGRKRGYCAILATQRISTLDKSCAGECNNKFIGRMTLDLDVKRAAFELGVAPAEALKMLRDLDRGQFHAFGPAIEPRGVTLMKVGKVQTTHPKAGQGQTLKPPRPSSSITAVVGELADLPQQAEAEIKDLAAAKAKIADLQRQVDAKPAPTAPVTTVIENPVLTDAQLAKLERHHEKTGDRVSAVWDRLQAIVNPVMELLKAEHAQADELLAAARAVRTASAQRMVTPPVSRVAPSIRTPGHAGSGDSVNDSGLTGPERRVLNSLAWWAAIGVADPVNTAVAMVAGYSPTSTSYTNPRGSLGRKALVSLPGPDRVALTAEGTSTADSPPTLATVAELHAAIQAKLTGPEWRLLKPLLENYPHTMTNDELAAAASYSPTSTSYTNPRGSLRTLGLIEYRDSKLKATALLFPAGLQ